jgi:hypothetical protein
MAVAGSASEVVAAASDDDSLRAALERARDAMDEWTIDHNPDCDCVLCQARTHARAALVAEAPVATGRR